MSSAKQLLRKRKKKLVFFYIISNISRYSFVYLFLHRFRTCTRFLRLVQDRRLWKTFDFATKRLMGRRIKKLLSTLQIGDIKAFKVRGYASNPSDKWRNNTITLKILRKLSACCPYLETVELRECYVNFLKVTRSKHMHLLQFHCFFMFIYDRVFNVSFLFIYFFSLFFF